MTTTHFDPLVCQECNATDGTYRGSIFKVPITVRMCKCEKRMLCEDCCHTVPIPDTIDDDEYCLDCFPEPDGIDTDAVGAEEQYQRAAEQKRKLHHGF